MAERVLAALDDAELGGRSLTTLDGSLVDDPHRTAARRILRRWKELHR
jgi:citrate lyase beta subunit